MARIKLKLPEKLPFETNISIRITDLNYGGHLGNDSLLSLIHEARIQFLASRGFTELDAGGASFIMSDCAIVYKSEGFYGQNLKVEVGAGEYSRVGFDIYYRFRISDESKLLAEAKTGIVTYNYAQKKVVEVPAKLKDLLGDCSHI